MPRSKSKKSRTSIPVKCPVCGVISFYSVEELSNDTIRCKNCGAELVLKPKDPYLELQSEIIKMWKELLRKLENIF